MIKLTREQKIDAYKYVLDRIGKPIKQITAEGHSIFACIQLTYWLKANVKDYENGTELEYFPEFRRKKPADRQEKYIWWSNEDHHLRVQAVEECLKEVSES